MPCTAGESTVLYQSDTPGALTAFALEVPEGMPPAALENLLVEMYWDGAAQPSVACPLPNLFACTAAGAEDFRCLPVAKSGGLYACFWYMPFASAKIVLCNAGGTDTLLRVGCRTKSIPGGEAAGLLRFCARTHGDAFGGLDAARFAPGGDRWPDWPLLRCRGRGRLCGVHLAVDNRWPEPDKPADEWWYGVGENKTIDWWWGEGDEKFFVDGEAFPSTFGTGSEDYIGYAWAAEPPFSLFDSAFAVQNAVPLTGNGMTSVARFHIVDNIPFQNELEAYIEKSKQTHGTIAAPCANTGRPAIGTWRRAAKKKATHEIGVTPMTQIEIKNNYLWLPVRTGDEMCRLTVMLAGQTVYELDIEAADGPAEFLRVVGRAALCWRDTGI